MFTRDEFLLPGFDLFSFRKSHCSHDPVDDTRQVPTCFVHIVLLAWVTYYRCRNIVSILLCLSGDGKFRDFWRGFISLYFVRKKLNVIPGQDSAYLDLLGCSADVQGQRMPKSLIMKKSVVIFPDTATIETMEAYIQT